MNIRHKEIGEFFRFLQGHAKNKEMFERIFERLESEINEEQKVDPNVDSNGYLDSLLHVHAATIDLFEDSKSFKGEKISGQDFRDFMVDLMQDISLHGLGAAEWEEDD